jgi:Kef-type K+ transport system membrane component KefB
VVTLNFVGLLIIAVIAVAGPLLAELVPGRVLPPVVIEVVGGIVVGPQVLGWVHVDVPITVLSFMGLGFLLFLAGLELEPDSLWSRQSRAAMVAFVVTLAFAFPLAAVLKVAGADADVRILALALTSTSLGVVAPILRDGGESTSPFGQNVLIAASIGEFASLILLTVLFSADPKSTPVQILYVVGMVASAAVAVVVITRWWGSRWFNNALHRLDETTSQLRVRAAFVLLLVFAALADRFGVDAVLGTFVAGIVLRVANHDTGPAKERFTAKLHAIGFGFLVPVFFIATGVQLDVRAMFHDVHTLLLVPLFLVGMAVARGLPSVALFRRRFRPKAAVAAGALQATSLTFPIIASTIGRSLHFMSAPTAAALVAAGLLSVIVFPIVALALRPWTEVAVAAGTAEA